MSEASELPCEVLERLCQLIEQTSGIYLETTRREGLARDVLARMDRLRLGHAVDYLEIVTGEEGRSELDLLVDAATNNETYFFREPNHFRALMNHILPALVAQRRSAITIWSAGCSTGEEPYSIAISVLKVAEHLRGATVRVLGTDVSPRAVERARLGHYGKNSFRGISESDLKTYFVHRPRHFEVKEAVKDLCDLRVMNLLEDTGDSFFENLDVIFCRNVTIYFREGTIRRLNQRLTNSLRDGGYLIFGASETLQHQHPGLQLIEVEGSFMYRKGARPPTGLRTGVTEEAPLRREGSGRLPRVLPTPALHRPARAPSAERIPAGARAPAAEAARSAQRAPAAPPQADAFGRALHLVREERYEEAAPLLSHIYGAGGGSGEALDALALLANIHINREDFPTALGLLGRALQAAPLRADLYLLYGVTLRYQKDDPGALQRLKKAAFIEPDCYLTHYYLAETYRSLGQSADSHREYRNALRLLRRARQEVPVSLMVLTAGFPQDYIERVCARYGT